MRWSDAIAAGLLLVFHGLLLAAIVARPVLPPRPESLHMTPDAVLIAASALVAAIWLTFALARKDR